MTSINCEKDTNYPLYLSLSEVTSDISSEQLLYLVIYDVPTAQTDGETYNFNLKIMNDGLIISRSYGILYYPSTITFENYGYAITIATNEGGEINVQQGTFSDLINTYLNEAS